MRRQSFLRAANALGLSVAASSKVFAQQMLLPPQAFGRSPKLQPFVDHLIVPPVLPHSSSYEIRMREVARKLHRELPPTTLWGYDGLYPGPTFVVRPSERIAVKWQNELPLKHILPIDHTIHGAANTPDVRTVVHLHGGVNYAHSDGYPEAWFTRNFAQTGPSFRREIYEYPNAQQPTTLWYHDHALGITRLNVLAGLAGFYLIRGEMDDELDESYVADIPLMIQDRAFENDGSFAYPSKGVTPVHPIWVPDFFGDVAVVNGTVWPYLDVEPKRYRFRILNGSNSRFYHLSLDSGEPFLQIGADRGFLPKPVRLKSLLLAPAERADVLVDFSRSSGRVVLTNDAPAPYPSGKPSLYNIMQFRVRGAIYALGAPKPEPKLPATLPLPFERSTVARVRDLSLDEYVDPKSQMPFMEVLDLKMWSAPVTETPKANTTEIWRFINTTNDAHAIHLHLVQFHILDRRPFDVALYKSTKQIKFTGPAQPPASNEREAPKDTVRADVGVVTSIITRFILPPSIHPEPGQKFRYVWHCHLLEHEDNDMMRPYDIVG